jgi:hypothetical protein
MKSPRVQRTGRPPAPQPLGANSSIATRATSSQRETNPRSWPHRHGETSPILVTKNKDQLINDWKKKSKSPHQVIYGRRCRERKGEILLDKSRRRRREAREGNKGGRCMWATLFVSVANFLSYQLLFLPCRRLAAAPRRAPLPTAAGRPRRYAPSSLLPTSSRVSWTSRHIDGRFPARVLSRYLNSGRRWPCLSTEPSFVVPATACVAPCVPRGLCSHRGGLIGRWRWLGTGRTGNFCVHEWFFRLLGCSSLVGVAEGSVAEELLGEAARHPSSLCLWLVHVSFCWVDDGRCNCIIYRFYDEIAYKNWVFRSNS